MDFGYWVTTAIAVLAFLAAAFTWYETRQQRVVSAESLATSREANKTAAQALHLSAAGSVQLVMRSVPQRPTPMHDTWFIQNKGLVPAKDVEAVISLVSTDDQGKETHSRIVETKRYGLIPVGGSVSFFLSAGHRITALRYKTPYSSEALDIPQQVIDTEDLIRRHYQEDFQT